MSFEAAQRLTEIMLGFAFILQSVEHLAGRADERGLFAVRLSLSALLLLGLQTHWAALGLAALSIAILHRFKGPYNGGSDRMGLLILFCLCLSYAPSERWGALGLGYLALQLVLSYLISGWVKIVNPDWRSGRALRDVFDFSAYPVAEDLRAFANLPKLMFAMSWAVMLFELVFPLALLHQGALYAALIIAALFHLSNAVLFGLNRFFWVWLAAYPSILWFQERFFG